MSIPNADHIFALSMSQIQKEIFITGATGFVGSHIARYLLTSGHRLTALRRDTSQMTLCADIEHQIRWVHGDLSEITFLQDEIGSQDVFVHAAAMVSLASKDHRRMFRVNVEGTKNMIDLASRMQVEQFVHISSVAALGMDEQGRTDESTIWSYQDGDTNQYSVSKFYAEQDVWRAHAEGMAVSILNPSVVIGPGDWSANSSRMFTRVDAGMPLYPSGTVGVVDVRDVALAVGLVIEQSVKGEQYVLNGANVSFQHLFSEIAQELDVKPPKRVLTPLIGSLYSALTRILSWFGLAEHITRQMIRSSAIVHKYDSTKSRDQLGLTYRDWQVTVRDTARAYLKHTQ